jgi:isopentenyl phosphate kinase
MVFSGSPIVVKFSSDFAILLLLFALEDKGVLKQIRPSEPLIRCLVEQSLQERFELR